METLTEQTAKELIRELRRYNNLVGNPTGKRWVKSTVIMEMTGWDKQRMLRARKNGDVVFKKDKGFWYDPTSLNQIYLKPQLKIA